MSIASELLATVATQIALRIEGAEEIQYTDGTRHRLASLKTLEDLRRQYGSEVAAEGTASGDGGMYTRTGTRTPKGSP